MLQVTGVVRSGKAIFVVCALTRRWQPTQAFHVFRFGGRHNSSDSLHAAAVLSSNETIAGRLRKTRGQTKMASGDMGEGAMTALQKGSTLADNKNSSTAALITNRSGGFSKTARVFLSQFVQGAKLLWAEIGLARETSARRKAGHVLSFQEDRLLRQVPRDVAKALPLLAVFAVPVLGYLSPVMGFIFPKTLLPAQFWSSPQRLEYMLQDAVQQEMLSFPELLRHLAMLASPARPNTSPRKLKAYARWFAAEGRLERLPRAHLILLVKSCNTLPPIKKAAAKFVTKARLISWLHKEAAMISNDDLALRQLLCRNGVLQLENGDKDSETRAAGIIKFRGQAVARLKLSPAEIAVLCWERGLLRSQHWSRGTLRRSAVDHEVPAAEVQAMLKSLEDWLSLYEYANNASTGTPAELSSRSSEGWLPGTLPASMVLHAPALLRLTHSATGAAPVCHLRVGRARR